MLQWNLEFISRSSFFVSNKFSYVKRDDRNIAVDGKLEPTFVGIILFKKRNILCGCIHKHSHIDKKEFSVNYITPFLQKLSKNDKHYFLIDGYFNINLLKCGSDHETSNFHRTKCSYFFTTIIPQPTRVTKKSRTQIENIFYSSFEYNTHTGNIIYQFSDHFIQFATLENFLSSAPVIESIVSIKRN